jgi:hypothetical protein
MDDVPMPFWFMVAVSVVMVMMAGYIIHDLLF